MRLTALAYVVTGAVAYPHFATKIPNGYSVPNPGPQGGVWAGVGHQNAAGGAERNAFGLDFAANDFVWNTALCESDSDGDGRSNGEELGDPNCQWGEGDVPLGPALSHPGIADKPQASDLVSSCENYVIPEDEVTMDISFSVPTQVDATQTHYICEQKVMDVPAKKLLHKIKHGVLLDNSDILHHMFVYICLTDRESTDGNRVGEGPYECSGNESGCSRVGGWAVGPKESCNPPNVGNELDFLEVDNVVVKIEAHYDNTAGVPQQDQSGIRLHMTPTLRPLTGGTMLVGMAVANADFIIPAQQELYPLVNTCPSAITDHLEHPVYVYAFTPHMHVKGRTLVTEQYRCGKKIGELGRINAYEFDNQQTYTVDPPVKILPGDALLTTCEYDTTQVDFDVLGGEATDDEMCLNFISLYPKPGTEKAPTLLSYCSTFENGFRNQDGNLFPGKVAIGDLDRSTVTQDFTSDVATSMGACCATDNCDDVYVAVENEACGIDADCSSELVCRGGLCELTTGSTLSGTTEVSGGFATTRCSLVVVAVATGTTSLALSWWRF